MALPLAKMGYFGSEGTNAPFPNSLDLTGNFSAEFSLTNIDATARTAQDIFSAQVGKASGWNIEIQIGTDGKISLIQDVTTQGSQGVSSESTLTLADFASAPKSLLLVSNLQTQTLTLYADGSIAASLSGWNVSGDIGLEAIQFGANLNGGAEGSAGQVHNKLVDTMRVGNIAIYNEALSPAPAIPEPATATLSLLALAGLVASRRRK